MSFIKALCIGLFYLTLCMRRVLFLHVNRGDYTHIPYLINNDMKDSRKSSGINLVQAAVLFPVIALTVILAGTFITNGSVLAQESDAPSMSSEVDGAYFSDNTENDLIAQGGLLESRSNVDADVSEDSTDTPNECATPYIEDDLRIDFDNDPESVLKLQSFLRTFEGYDEVSLTGEFDESTLEAVMSFQTRYAEEILEPWGYQPDEATGYVYITTKKQINEIYCDEQFSLTSQQQEEIREYREMLNTWRAQGASFETPNYLAEYYGTTDTPTATTDDQEDEPATDTADDTDADDDADDEVADDAADETSTTSTSTETEETDERGFFQRLFGIGGDDDEDDSATTTATTTDADDPDEDEDTAATTTDDEDEATATSATTTATGSVDGIASGVYNGINSIFNFLLSPTFLLIILVVLILLLIATIIEGNDDTEGDDVDDIDPWAEYDDTQEVGTDTDADAEEDEVVDEAAPTPPDTEEKYTEEKSTDSASSTDDSSSNTEDKSTGRN